MKTHLPVALRKALIAAIFAVSFGVYNAHAAEPEQTTPSPEMNTYGNISSANQSLSASGDTGIRVEAVTDTADNLTIITENGDVEIGTIQATKTKQVDALTITSGGNLYIGESGAVGNEDGNNDDSAFVTNVNIEVWGDFTVGTVEGAGNVIVFCGTQETTSEVNMDIGGSFISLQSVDIRPGGHSEQSGNAYINIGGDASFLGETATVQGGGQNSTAEALFTVGGAITMENEGGATVGHGATLTANGGSISINSGDNNEIAGDLIASDKVSIAGTCNTIVQTSGLTVDISAKNGVSVVSTSPDTFGNWLQNAAVYTEQGGVKMTTESMHYVYFSSIQAESGDVEILDGGIDVNGSTVQADAGEVSMNGDSVSVIDSAVTASGQVEIAGSDASGDGTGLAHVTVIGQSINIGHEDTHTSISAHEGGLSTLDAGEDINVTGSAVAVADDTSIDSTGGNIAITATIGQVSVAGGNVTSGQGEVAIGGATETRLAGVEVSGASVAVGSGTGSTMIVSEEGTPTTIDATGNITVKDKAVTLEENSVITSEQGDIDIIATDSALSVTGGSVTTGQGTIAINGATSTTVSGAEVGIAESSDAVVAVEIGQPGAGTTTIDGSTVNASGHVKVDGASVEIKNDSDIVSSDGDVTIAATGNNELSGDAVTATTGTVTVTSGATNTIAASVTAGADVEVTAGENNTITGDVTAGSTVEITAAGNNVVSSDIAGGTDVTIATTGGNNELSGDTVTATTGSVTVSADTGNTISAAVIVGSDVEVTAGENNSITGDVTAGNTVEITAAGNNVVSSDIVGGADVTIATTGGNNELSGDTVTATAGTVTVTSGATNTVVATVTAGADVEVTAGENNTITGDVTAGNAVEITAAGNNAVSSDIVGGTDVAIATTGGNNELSGDTVTATTGTVTVSADAGNTISAVVTAGADVEVTAGENNTITGDVTAGNTVEITAAGNNVVSSDIAGGTDVTIASSGGNNELSGDTVTATAGTVTVTSGATNTVVATVTAGADVEVTAGENNTITGDVTAGNAVEITAAGNNAVSSDIVGGTDVAIATTGGNNELNGGIVTATNGAISLDAGDAGINQVNGATLDAQHSAAGGADDSDGTIAMTGSSNEIIKGASLQADAGVSISSTGTGLVDCNGISASSVTAITGDIAISAAKFNTIAEESEIEAESGNVSLAGSRNRVLDSTVTAGADVTMGAVEGSSAIAQNVVLSTTGEAMIKAAGRVSIQGMNSIYRESNSPSEVSIIAEQGDIDVSGSNLIALASLQAGGAVRITTGEGNMTTTVENSSLMGSSVVIAGDITSRAATDLAVVTGENTLVEAKSITLNNVSVVDTGKGTSNIRATEGGDISILDRVDLASATLTSAGRIVVDTGHVLNARAASGLDGNLVGEGDINKSGGDALQLSGDNTGFNGSIYVNGAEGGVQGSVVDADNAGSWLEISGAGVGSASSIVLKNTDLLVNSETAQIGTLDTTQDAVDNNAATGGTLQADGSYTADANTRTDFGTIGSVVELNQGTSGDVLQASQLKLSDATLLKLDATVDAAGNASSDTIQVAGDIDLAAARTGNKVSPASAPATARVFITHHGDAANAADGARTTILQGNMASDINEDVLYDVALSENGTYQRTLQDRNVHLENKGDHVDLVYSKNYRSAAKDAHLSAVADAMKELSDSFHHTEGTLAASADTMKRLVDAFDYTRSEDAALRGLKSVAGTGNVLPRLMQFDSSRRHLSALRQQMEMPVCKYAWKGALNRTNNVWMSYTGAYDNLSGDSNMGDYTRNAQGAIVGVDRSLSCKLRVGLSLGYETGTGEADSNSVDADTFFVDAYATGVTGYFKHRASVGLATTSFDTERNVLVEAGYHTFNGPVKGCTDGLTLNFGYEISSDYHFSERSRMTRYLAVNLAWHQLDAVKEDGLGAVGLITEFEDEWQADLALGVNYIHEFAALRNQKLASFYANAAVHLELLNDRVTATNRLGDTGAGWQTSSMERSPLYFELGAGVVVPLSPTWTGTAGASFEIGPDRYGFSGGVGARYSF